MVPSPVPVTLHPHSAHPNLYVQPPKYKTTVRVGSNDRLLSQLRIVKIIMNKNLNLYYIVFIVGLFPLLTSCKRGRGPEESLPINSRPIFNIGIPAEPISKNIPFEFNGLMIVIECRLNDVPCKMMLDTGSESIYLFEDKLDKFKLKTIGFSSSGYTAAGSYSGKVIEEFSIILPGDIKVISAYCCTIAKFADKPDIDGIIGGPVLKALDAIIDYEKRTLTLKTDKILNK
jgi:hypothetical protein